MERLSNMMKHNYSNFILKSNLLLDALKLFEAANILVDLRRQCLILCWKNHIVVPVN